MKFSFILLLICLNLFSCKKEKKLNCESANKGLIESDFIFGCNCFWSVKEGVINDDSTYRSFSFASGHRPYMTVSDKCDSSKLPFIDFNKNTLLGMRVSAGDPQSYTVLKNVEKDEENKIYKYKITIQQCSMIVDPIGTTFMAWVIVPKLPEGYTVQYETEKVYPN